MMAGGASFAPRRWSLPAPRSRRAEQVGVFVYRLNYRAESREEYRVFVRIRSGVEQVSVAVGNRPVVVLARTVDSREGLFVQQAYQTVFFRHVAQNFHNHHVMVCRQVQLFEHGRDFELRGRNFVVARLCGNSDFPKLQIDVVHEIDDARLDCSEIVVFKLLVLLRRSAEERSARLHEVGALYVEFAVYEEVFLFRAERYVCAGVLFDSEALHQAFCLRTQNLYGAQKRRLFVEHFARVGTEHCGNGTASRRRRFF